MSILSRPVFLASLLLLPLAASPSLRARERTQEKETKTVEKDKPAEPAPAAPKEESSVTDHALKTGAQTIAYKATAATILLKNEKEEPTALIYYTAYTRSDAKDMSQRPISFVYNGGPGSSSVWLHMGAFGPKRVITANAEPTPPAPYKVTDNAGSLLDKTDLVFIDPVGTGFSHAVGKAQDKDFWGVDSDVKSLAELISRLTMASILTASFSSLPSSISVRFRSILARTSPMSSIYPATPRPRGITKFFAVPRTTLAR